MDLTQAQLVSGLRAEWESFAALIGSLSPAEWDAPTRCTGWAVRDVAGHVTGSAADSARGTIGTRTADQQAASLRGHGAADLAETLSAAASRLCPFLLSLDDETWAGPSPVPERSLGNGVLTLWYDTFVHGDDIRAALGQPSQDGPGLTASVLWLRAELDRRRWPGAGLLREDLPDPMRFVLVAAGRADAAELGLHESVNVHA